MNKKLKRSKSLKSKKKGKKKDKSLAINADIESEGSMLESEHFDPFGSDSDGETFLQRRPTIQSGK